LNSSQYLLQAVFRFFVFYFCALRNDVYLILFLLDGAVVAAAADVVAIAIAIAARIVLYVQ